jgi:hypothetical protein
VLAGDFGGIAGHAGGSEEVDHLPDAHQILVSGLGERFSALSDRSKDRMSPPSCPGRGVDHDGRPTADAGAGVTERLPRRDDVGVDSVVKLCAVGALCKGGVAPIHDVTPGQG